MSSLEKFQPWEGLSLSSSRTGTSPPLGEEGLLLLHFRRNDICVEIQTVSVTFPKHGAGWRGGQHSRRGNGVCGGLGASGKLDPRAPGGWKFAVFGEQREEGCETAGQARWDLQPRNSAGRRGRGQELTGQGGTSPASSG